MTHKPIHLSGRVVVLPTTKGVFEDLGGVLMDAAQQAVRDRGVFHLALSGGTTPKPFYELLAQDQRYRDIPWHNTHLWIVDERHVPENDDRNNFKMIRSSLVEHTAIEPSNVHPIPTGEPDPAGAYEQTLRTVFSPVTGEVPCLDFVLLGMGDDAHTASLFPHSPALGEQDRLIADNDGPTVVPPARITMTYPFLNAARHVAVLVVGAKKAATLRRIEQVLANDGPQPQALPITGIRPTIGTLSWYLDAPAAAAG